MMERERGKPGDLGERIREQRRGLRRERILEEGEKEERKIKKNGEREERQIEYRDRNREVRGRGRKTGAQPQVEERLERQETDSREARKVRRKRLERLETGSVDKLEGKREER
jgi:hypothetical protein